MNGRMPFQSRNGLLKYLQARRELEGANKKKTLKQFRGARHRMTVGEHVASGRGLLEYYHVLIDYRNGNEKIVSKALTRKKAWLLNKRLEGTGLAFALCGKAAS